MGKVKFTPIQKLIINEFAKFEPSPAHFYFTGGTALSVFYLNHRYSNDLDFFSEKKLEDEILTEFINKISSKIALKHRFTTIERTRVFEFTKNNKLLIKIDFAYYPYPRLEKGKIYQGITVDSLLDIATNKLLLITQRSDIKDFVDLYFLLKRFTLWDLMCAVEKKFKREIDLLLLSAEFLKVEEFNFLPKMAVSLKLDDLQKFFKKRAKKLGSRAVKK